jgi:hypothetical protein
MRPGSLSKLTSVAALLLFVAVMLALSIRVTFAVLPPV